MSLNSAARSKSSLPAAFCISASRVLMRSLFRPLRNSQAFSMRSRYSSWLMRPMHGAAQFLMMSLWQCLKSFSSGFIGRHTRNPKWRFIQLMVVLSAEE